MSPPDEERFVSAAERLIIRSHKILDGPVTWFRKTIVEPNRKEYNWYHRQFRRVPTIDECYIDDRICWYEANEQFKRDRIVDSQIVNILRTRVDDCFREEYPDHFPKCKKLQDDYETAAANWFSRYGDLGAYYSVDKSYMKQKHRLLWERRHGKIGTGMKNKNDTGEAETSDE